MIVSDHQGKPLRSNGLGPWLARVAPGNARGVMGVVLTTDARVRALNRQYRGIDRATDVLSFPLEDDRGTLASRHLGDVVIARGTAVRQARQAGHSTGTELRVLALHGLLHLLGYDHDDGSPAMARLEQRLRRKGGLREGLIERTTAR